MTVPTSTTDRPERPGRSEGAAGRTQRRRLKVAGTVQGVGFRPFVHRTACALGLSGEVHNDAAGVSVEVEGPPAALDRFVAEVTGDPPPLAAITAWHLERVPPTGGRGFVIADSDAEGPTGGLFVPVDVGPCERCLAELTDPGDRRYRYPFLACTDCGPRYTITTRLPYDRLGTTMAPFPLCPACRSEYQDPRDRRFHAQPIACPACGPRLRLATCDDTTLAYRDEALAGAVRCLLNGGTLAVKGVGGFHLATLADDTVAVTRLRRRKRRDAKPFAVLLVDAAVAATVVSLDDPATRLLTSPPRPIVLAPRRGTGAVADAVAPRLSELGVLLPPSPLHHLLASDVARPLVLTSGNVSHEPIVTDDRDAFARLGSLADAVLTHDRAIHVRCDDSVVRAGVAGGPQPVRRSRGMAPAPLALPPGCERTVLAVGAELKSTVAIARGGTAVVSHHLGDLDHPAAHRGFLGAIDHLLRVHDVTPEVVAHDLHPQYRSTAFADELDLPRRAVQHHHAHIAACLAEHGQMGPAVGIALDGLGWGTDGTAWGGELLVCDLEACDRVGHLRAVPLPGGDAAVREPWRMAVSWAVAAFGVDVLPTAVTDLDARWSQVRDVVTSGQAIATSSAGRLFDAVASLLGVRSTIDYEGQAAIELEALARRVAPADAPPLAPVVTDDHQGLRVLDPSPTIRDLLARSRSGTGPARLAAAFHRELAIAVADAAAAVAGTRDLEVVALSGGVFQNARLTTAVADRLGAAGLRVLIHRRVPANDGGISFGQAAIAAYGRGAG